MAMSLPGDDGMAVVGMIQGDGCRHAWIAPHATVKKGELAAVTLKGRDHLVGVTVGRHCDSPIEMGRVIYSGAGGQRGPPLRRRRPPSHRRRASLALALDLQKSILRCPRILVCSVDAQLHPTLSFLRA
ncbi:hypothetical protein NL676_035081 [Syzygium grande]|nr:hypothetical protein NL676_035081 [Syzygium grande]